MFKLVVLSALVAVAMAAPKPGVLGAPAALAYSAPVVAHSAVVGSVPTAVSSSSNTVVHNAAVVSKTVAAPVAYAAPALAYAAPAVAYAAPGVRTVVAGAPPISTYAAHGLVKGYGAQIAAPLAYGAHGIYAY